MISPENRVAAILDTVGALIVFVDTDGRVVRFNRACEELTGYSPAELRGQVIWDVLVPEADRESVRATFTQLVAERLPIDCESRWITRQGESRIISWSNTVFLREDETVEYVIGTGVDITDRLRLEREIIEVSEEERRRIGHELHERLCNHLAGTSLIAGALADEFRKGKEIDINRLDQVAKLISEAVEQAHVLARGLLPVKIEEEGLVAAIQEMVADVQRLSGISCAFVAAQGLPELAHTSVANHLYRIAQEAVANAVSHAHPTLIDVRLREMQGAVILTIDDDGIGMPTEPPPSGLGLHMMRYRARMIGGSLTIEPRPGGGTRVRTTAPVPAERPFTMNGLSVIQEERDGARLQ